MSEIDIGVETGLSNSQIIGGIEGAALAIKAGSTPAKISEMLTGASYRKAVEDMSGGKNTVVVDAQGNSNVMVRIPRFTYDELGEAILNKLGIDMQLGTGTCTAFISDGVERKEILIAKYLASAGVNGGCSVVGGITPRTSVNYDTAKALCTSKGAGWHMMSIHEWCAISLWSLANDAVPRGNTNYGRSHENKLEKGRRYDSLLAGDSAGTGRTDTGTGPSTWSHDGTEFGIQDLVGNVWEWVDQFKINEGQVVATADNNISLAESSWLYHDAFFDSLSTLAVGNVSAGPPILSNSVVNRNGQLDYDGYDYPFLYNSRFDALSKSDTYVKNQLMRRLLVEFAATSMQGSVWVRNHGERLPLRGGGWYSGSSAGLGALIANIPRSYSGSNIGFRPAFFV
jgi:hypothetical protein